MKNSKLLLCSLFLLLFFVSFCIRKSGIDFAGAQKEKETALSAVSEAAQNINLSSEKCEGEGNPLSTYYYDKDRDSFGDKEKIQYMCLDDYKTEFASKNSPAWVSDSSDCDDSDKTRNPGATETCDNGIDEDCDGIIDPSVAYLDADSDGYGSSLSSFDTQDCMLPPAKDGVSYVFNNFDCDDTTSDIGVADEYYIDGDSDKFGKSGSDPNSSCDPLTGWVTNDEDCDDEDPSVKTSGEDPNMEDKDCDGVDDLLDLCSGTNSSLLDDGDNDKDGCFGGEDCDDDDTDPLKIKIKDNDCDGVLSELDCDDDDNTQTDMITDDDNQDCDATKAFSSDGSCSHDYCDCDDNDSESETTETDADCDGTLKDSDCDDEDENKPSLDQDCDGVSSSEDCDDNDEGNSSTASLWYEDLDGDGAGSASSGIYTCLNTLDSNSYVADATDYCDNNADYKGDDYDHFANDADCDGLCDEHSTSVFLDADCDGSCDGGVDLTKDSDCDAICDASGLSTELDSECDDICDTSGASTSIDSECDNTCDDSTTGADNFLICDANDELQGSCDQDCDDQCDNCSEINFRFLEGELVICPPDFVIWKGTCRLDCTDASDCVTGWADNDDKSETDCSWDSDNTCDPRNYTIPCYGLWPHSDSDTPSGEAQTYDDTGSTKLDKSYDGHWRTTPLLVTDDFLEGNCEALNFAVGTEDNLKNCQRDDCQSISSELITDETKEDLVCPGALVLNDDNQCEPREDINILQDSNGLEVFCPPDFSLDLSDNFCFLKCSLGDACASDWADNDGDPNTDCGWSTVLNRCDPRQYEIPCWGSWPMQTWSGTDIGVSKDYSEGGGTMVSSWYWKTNPLLVPEDFTCE